MYKYVVYDGASVASEYQVILFEGTDKQQALGIANEYGGIVYRFDAEDTDMVDGKLVRIAHNLNK